MNKRLEECAIRKCRSLISLKNAPGCGSFKSKSQGRHHSKDAKNPNKSPSATTRTNSKVKPSWMNKHLPADKMFKPHTWNGKSWYYCGPETGGKCNGVYQCHKPNQCEGAGHFKKKRDDSNNSGKQDYKNSNRNSKRWLQLAKAMEATANDDHDCECSVVSDE